MKICAIGDVHGLTIWKKIVEKELPVCDKIIFLGDYFDSHDTSITPEKQLKNFQGIVELLNEYPDKINLLIGNHDAHYIGCSRCSGHNIFTAISARSSLKSLIKEKKLKVTVKYDNYLFSHAGISKFWMEVAKLESLEEINELFHENPNILDFVEIQNECPEPSGDNSYQCPVWIRPNSLLNNLIGDYYQVVGHTHLNEITIVVNQHKQKLILVDTLPKQYLVIDTKKELEIPKMLVLKQ